MSTEIAAHEVEEIGMSNMFTSLVYFLLYLRKRSAETYLFYSRFLIGVEHLLRDVKDTTISTLATEVCVLDSLQKLERFIIIPLNVC